MDLLECSFDATVFTGNRLRRLAHDVGRAMFNKVVLTVHAESLLPDVCFSVDEPPLPATNDAPGFPPVEIQGTRRSHATHASTTDPEAWRRRKSRSRDVRGPCPNGNRHGLPVDFTVGRADGHAKREVVPVLLDEARARGLGDRRVTLHVVPHRHSAIDDRTTRHASYRLNPRSRILAGRSSTGPSRHAGRGVEAKGGAGVPAGQRSASRSRGNARRQQTTPAHLGMAEIGVCTNPGSPGRPWSMNRIGSFCGLYRGIDTRYGGEA